MEIKYLNKNIIFATEPFILQGCNAQGKMGSGVAKAIRNRWPEVYLPYKKYCEDNNSAHIMGTIYPVSCEDKTILNAISQQHYGYDGKKYASYDAIDLIMQEVEMRISGQQLALSMIGSSLGGCSWSVVSEIIKDRLKTVIPTVYYV